MTNRYNNFSSMMAKAIPNSQNDKMHVAIVGGGLAGLAAAAALESHGCRVEIFEAGSRLGGRAGSLWDQTTAQQVDRCQHVAMGCCTNLIDFCRLCGIEDLFTRQNTLHFIGPDARRYDFSAVGWLPAPIHLAPAVLRMGYLNIRNRLSILRAMRQLLKARELKVDEPVEQWLQRQGQSQQAIKLFWSTVLESALSEKLERVSLATARQVFVEGFMSSRRAYELLVPSVTLSELFDVRVSDFLSARGVVIHRRTRVVRIDGDAAAAVSLTLSNSQRQEFDAFVVAVPWHGVKRLLSPTLTAALTRLDNLDAIRPATIIAVHLWYDRPITELPNAVLPGRMSQWIFSRGDGYSQVVISAADELLRLPRQEILQAVLAELQEAFPDAGNTQLVHWRVVKSPRAVFSPRPGVDAMRPGQKTALKNLALAGDWTNTHWPATMEGAVRSGYLAAEAIISNAANFSAIPKLL